MKNMIEAMARFFAGLKLLASAKPDVQAINKIVEEGEAAVAAMKTKAEEDEAAEAAAKAGAGGEAVPPANEPDGDKPPAKPGAVSQVRIKHEETRTTRQADIARIADLEKKLAEAKATIALTESTKQIAEAGISESLTPEMLSAINDPAARIAVLAIAKKLHESNPFGIGNPARGASGDANGAAAGSFVAGLKTRLNGRK